MTLIRWQPVRELPNFGGLMRRFFDDFDGFPSVEIGSFNPRLDLSEDDKNVYVHVELPGLKKEDVKITVNDENILTIRGKKAREEKSEGRNFYRMERSFGDFSRTLALPAEVRAEEIVAKFNDGTLSLEIPKKEPSKPKEREISIK